MTLPQIVDREVWLAARVELLVREKEMTRRIDALNADRRRLPMVRVNEPYEFHGAHGPARLADLFDGRRQLIVQHVMFDPSWDDACPSCTAGVDELSPGLIEHLNARDTSFALISRAPQPKLADYQARKGWTIPWYSSHGTNFNLDYGVTMDPSDEDPPIYNYKPLPWAVEPGTTQEQPGMSCFLKVDDAVFHTYSTFGRGVDHLGGAYGFLDLTALGRQEEWEEPKGRASSARPSVPNFLTPS
ncbi:DUF899 domain-containing protein [Winogradskya humida]|uniref:Dithiol-disulfide oxidoreductase (DUF899 family) n=1 Tax=Winogradskya humida TaxID=113566 RepID=A0ABQ3ZJM0_9ACTN|nr:DUF899 domain-containing protein [Actinoplanes humidus]GIE18704.1 hypothetical protein Ahu01nite_018060 [Actinoplanes humidus]